MRAVIQRGAYKTGKTWMKMLEWHFKIPMTEAGLPGSGANLNSQN
jgi:hypothetical protein